MAGWFGPRDCNESCCEQACDSACGVGPFSSLKLKVVVSGLPSTTGTYSTMDGNPQTGGCDANEARGDGSGFSGLNGTYFTDFVLDSDGCPLFTGDSFSQLVKLASVPITYAWDVFRYDTCNYCEITTERSASQTCDFELWIEGDLRAGATQLMRAFVSATNCTFGDPIALQHADFRMPPDSQNSIVTWTAPEDCDKFPDGSELFTGEVVIPPNDTDGACVTGRGEIVVGSYTIEVSVIAS